VTQNHPRGFGHRIIQVHPSLRCNLACAHCYSTSGPREKATLDVAVLRQVITDARALGFESLSVSGGEPLMYPALDEILGHARAVGMNTGLVTNGALVTTATAERLAHLVDVVAVSVDGTSDLHNRIRGSHQSFDRAMRALDYLAEFEVPTVVLHTVTRSSLGMVAELAHIAAAHSASAIRLHPLEMYGRARDLMIPEALTPSERNRLFLQVLALNWLLDSRQDPLDVQIDLALRSQLLANASRVYADTDAADLGGELGFGAEMVDSIVVGTDGLVVPLAYGINPRYRICDLSATTLLAGWEQFLNERHEGFLALGRRVLQHLEADSGALVVNWHELLVAESNGTLLDESADSTQPAGSVGDDKAVSAAQTIRYRPSA
jgi:MoaA/NifB/PqqE/SkfB family radical SAM enzyme